MKIGLVTDFYYPWIGGPAPLIRNLGHGLAARGHSVYLLCPSETGPPRSDTDGAIEVHRVRTLPVPFGYHMRVACNPLMDTSRWLDTVSPDVVHVHHPFPLSAAAAWLTARRKIPLIATNHTVPACSLWGVNRHHTLYRALSVALGKWITHVLDWCDEVTTPTRTAAGLLREMGYRDVVLPISNGVDTDRFAPGPYPFDLARRLGVEGRPVVLYTGRLDAEKQMDVWLRAAALVARDSDALFLVGGQGTDRARLEALCRELGLQDRVRFFGYLDEPEYPSVYRLADVFCITSTVELQSIATLEAISTGLPVVAADAAALPEIVRSGDNGLLVAPGDFTGVAGAILQILHDENTRRRMSELSRNLALEHTMSNTIEKYEALMAGASARARTA